MFPHNIIVALHNYTTRFLQHVKINGQNKDKDNDKDQQAKQTGKYASTQIMR